MGDGRGEGERRAFRVGCDEAGKGPVLGPMVAAAVRADPAALPEGIDDSKRLAPARREEIAAALRDDDAVAVGVAVVPPSRIDAPETDMNSLTVAAHAEAVAAAARDGDAVVADAGDVDEARFGRRVASDVGDAGVEVSVRAEHGGDESYALVGAASVVAKVERDARVAAIAEEYAEYGPVGSGYPSDGTTRKFLREYVGETGELPDCARASWSTCDDVLAAAAQSSLDQF
ncbi:ribonuclease HII [Halopelagius longus]|uniref:Ribonuclease HII n=1 Tax=Halopelagius longus TaxID=1236180 RepID=A0A1H0XZL9_9EURY|nr:ribonuclease HII [Halopelagius longus]RDI72195.1 ribonuclease HII [Halopelagius longus]SDQ08337.1 RNase HII [Halopelagius longus]